MINKKPYSKCLNNVVRSGQKGAILIWLMFALVAVSSLGASMASLTTSAKFDELFANTQMKAYYLAEGGARFVLLMSKREEDTPLRDKQTTLVLSNNDKVEVILTIGTNMKIESTGTTREATWSQGKRKLVYEVESATGFDPFDISKWDATTGGATVS